MSNGHSLDDARKCISVLSAVVKCSQHPVKSANFDVVAVISKALLDNLVKFKVEWTESLSIQASSDCWPSTSNAPEGTIVDDPRVRLGYLLSEIFKYMAEDLKICREESTDEYTILSVKDQAIVVASAQFFVLAQLVPYLDDGVGIPVRKRSQFVKAWKQIDEDEAIKKAQIVRFLNTMKELFECNESLKNELTKSFLADIICAIEQVAHFGGEPCKWVEEFLLTINQVTLVVVLMTLSKTYDQTKPPPHWFTLAIGDRLSSVLRSPEGLFHTLGACSELGGEQFWSNTPVITRVARQLILPSKHIKRMGYFENMNKQFVSVFQKSVFPENGLIRLYTYFIDEMAVSCPLAGEIFLLDRLLKPFEILKEQNLDTFKWNKDSLFALHMINLLSEDNICPKLLLNSPRYIQLFPILLGFLTSKCFDQEVTDPFLKNIIDEIQKILKFLSKKIENLSHLLLSFILSTNEDLFQIEYKKTLVVPVEETLEKELILAHLRRTDVEEYILLKLDAILKLINMLEEDARSCLLIEILCDSVELWTTSVVTNEEPRFCGTLGQTTEHEHKRQASHMVALFCFQHLGEKEIDSKKNTIIKSMCKFIDLILKKSIEWMNQEDENSKFFDITKTPSDDELKMIEIQQISTKMAVGLAAGVIAAGTSESIEYLPLIAKSISNFVSAVASTKSNNFSEVAKDGNQILQLLESLGIKASKQVPLPKTKKKLTKSVDPIKQLEEDLYDEMIPIRGEALIRVSKAIRNKNNRFISILDTWLFEKVKDLVEDPDSYVFLAAINALAEIACYNPKKYLEELLTVFENLGDLQKKLGLEGQEDPIVMQRGKIAEVIGKVFRVLGDLAPSWIKRSANTFLSSLKDEHDIIRASSLSAFSDLIWACKGRGLESIVVELLFAINSLLKTDKNYIVRRSAIHVVRVLICSCSRNLLNTLGVHLLDIRRELMRLYRYDSDYVVRLHAEICLGEMEHGLNSGVESEMSSRFRIINI